MMGRRQKLKGGDEWDAVYARTKLYVFDKPGVAKKTKRKMNKRWRKEFKQELLRYRKKKIESELQG